MKTGSSVAEAVERLLAGEVIGLPTETVYGLAAVGTNPSAISRIFELKGRPADHPLILHLAHADWLKDFAREIPESAWTLAEAFWPGPLTIILKRSDRVPLEVTGGLDTVALRVPAHPLALAVLGGCGRPLAAPSANRFGRVSPTQAAHVRSEFGEALPCVLDGGMCTVGVESTIVDLSGESPRLLRPGGVPRSAIEQILGRSLEIGASPTSDVRAPGTLASHYAPRAAVQLLEAGALLDTLLAGAPAKAGFIWHGALGSPARFESWQKRSVEEGLLLLTRDHAPQSPMVASIPGDSGATAQHLYAALRALDEAGCAVIFTTIPAPDGLGEAVADRLTRAAAPRP